MNETSVIADKTHQRCCYRTTINLVMVTVTQTPVSSHHTILWINFLEHRIIIGCEIIPQVHRTCDEYRVDEVVVDMGR